MTGIGDWGLDRAWLRECLCLLGHWEPPVGLSIQLGS